MKSASVVLLIALSYVAYTCAQDVYGYYGFDGLFTSSSIGYTYNDPTTSATAVLENINNYPTITIPWNFVVGGVNFGNQIVFSDDFYIYFNEDTNNNYQYFGVYASDYYSYNIQSAYYDVQGTAPNRVAIFTWVNAQDYYSNGQISDNTAQIMLYENGNVQVNAKSLRSSANSYYTYIGTYFINDNYNSNNYITNMNFPVWSVNPPSTITQTSYLFTIGASAAPVDLCGNGVVDSGEQCDGGACCTSTCTFLDTTNVCRQSAGDCDIAESCTGTSSTCPDDTFKTSTTPCSLGFGVCDNTLDRMCSGNSAQCDGVPVPVLDMSVIQWFGYNVISFGTFSASSGNIGGRLAVRNDVTLGSGVSIGSEVVYTITSDPSLLSTSRPITFSFIGGGDVVWGNGELFPDSTYARIEYGYAGNSLNAPDFLAARFLGNITSEGPVGSHFDDAQSYYISVSQNMAELTSNVDVSFQWGGLFLNCSDDSADRYVASIDSSLMSTATWYSVNNCAYGAPWILNVGGTGDVIFQGGDFPEIGEKVVFNILGTRNVVAQSGINANVLAPTSSFSQQGGVTYGIIIAADIPQMSSAENPNCQDYQAFDIVSVATNDANSGSNQLEVASLSSFSAGTANVGGGNTISFSSAIIDSDGHITLQLSSPLSSKISAGTFLTQHVSNPSGNRTEITITQVDATSSNDSVTIACSLIVILVALMF